MACDEQTVEIPGVTRFPITGPAPYNTLVCCTYEAPYYFINGTTLTHSTQRFYSNFILSKFEQTNPPPQFVHTTFACLPQAGPGNGDTEAFQKDAWLFAIDAIDGCGFDETGRFFVEVDVAVLFPRPTPGSGDELIISVTSNILVTEPQPGPPNHGRLPPHRPE
jgi:hypothetical protein